jgi:hypothetical protein
MTLPHVDRVLERFKRIRAVFSESFANARPHATSYDWFSESEVASLDRANDVDAPEHVDDQSWRDLDMPAYLRRIGQHASLCARQAIYRRLRRGAIAPGVVADLLREHPPAELTALIEPAGPIRDALRCARDDITPHLFHGARIVTPGWTERLWLAPWGLALIWTLQWLFAWPAVVGIGATLAYIGLVGFVQIRLFPRLQEWKKLRAGLLLVLASARSLGALGVTRRGRLYGALADDLPETGRLAALISGRLYDRFAAIAEYANLLAMSEYATLRASVERFEAALPSLRRVYEQVAECEADLCFLEHALSAGRICVAELATEGDVVFTDLKSPLFEDCQPLSLRMGDRSLLLSGQNGIGKSTLLRAIGINLLVARAFGVCYAAQARVPPVTVWVSIENKDSIEDRQSLYMAELLRAQTLVKAAESEGRTAFFIIDEVFRGTNNIESVAAGAAVLQHLAAHARVVVTSHNLALGKILRRSYRPLHLVRMQGKGLILEDGLLPDTNGIALMGRYDFPPSVLREADRVRAWYADYVLQPGDFPLEDGAGREPAHSPPKVSAAFTSSSSNPIR